MKARNVAEKDYDTFMRRLILTVCGLLAVVFIPLFIYASHLESRLDTFENNLQHRPPLELEGDDIARGDIFHLTANPVQGQLVYVPAYSHVYHGKGEPYLLTITLSVRNTSVDKEIVVKEIRYFDTRGKEIKSYLDKPVRLPALGTTEVVIERDDASGGSGANFLLEWYADRPVTEPIVEAIMIGTGSQQGISFARRGSVISEVVPDSDADKAGDTE
jgi:hypothetical protein